MAAHSLLWNVLSATDHVLQTVANENETDRSCRVSLYCRIISDRLR